LKHGLLFLFPFHVESHVGRNREGISNLVISLSLLHNHQPHRASPSSSKLNFKRIFYSPNRTSHTHLNHQHEIYNNHRSPCPPLHHPRCAYPTNNSHPRCHSTMDHHELQRWLLPRCLRLQLQHQFSQPPTHRIRSRFQHFLHRQRYPGQISCM